MVILVYKGNETVRFTYSCSVNDDASALCRSIFTIVNQFTRVNWLITALLSRLPSESNYIEEIQKIQGKLKINIDDRELEPWSDSSVIDTVSSRLAEISAESGLNLTLSDADNDTHVQRTLYDVDSACLWFVARPLLTPAGKKSQTLGRALGTENDKSRVIVRPSRSLAAGQPPREGMSDSERMRLYGLMRQREEALRDAEEVSGVGAGGWADTKQMREQLQGISDIRLHQIIMSEGSSTPSSDGEHPLPENLAERLDELEREYYGNGVEDDSGRIDEITDIIAGTDGDNLSELSTDGIEEGKGEEDEAASRLKFLLEDDPELLMPAEADIPPPLIGTGFVPNKDVLDQFGAIDAAIGSVTPASEWQNLVDTVFPGTAYAASVSAPNFFANSVMDARQSRSKYAPSGSRSVTRAGSQAPTSKVVPSGQSILDDDAQSVAMTTPSSYGSLSRGMVITDHRREEDLIKDIDRQLKQLSTAPRPHLTPEEVQQITEMAEKDPIASRIRHIIGIQDSAQIVQSNEPETKSEHQEMVEEPQPEPQEEPRPEMKGWLLPPTQLNQSREEEVNEADEVVDLTVMQPVTNIDDADLDEASTLPRQRVLVSGDSKLTPAALAQLDAENKRQERQAFITQLDALDLPLLSENPQLLRQEMNQLLANAYRIVDMEDEQNAATPRLEPPVHTDDAEGQSENVAHPTTEQPALMPLRRPGSRNSATTTQTPAVPPIKPPLKSPRPFSGSDHSARKNQLPAIQK